MQRATALSPEQMRQAVADYVAAVHRAYAASTTRLPPLVAGTLPLLAATEPFGVVAAAAPGNLHLIATRTLLPPGPGSDTDVFGQEGELRWQLRFYDPLIVPALDGIDADDADGPEQVRRVLGIRTWIYHTVASYGSELTRHHADHVGGALAASHLGTARDFQRMRGLVQGPAAVTLVDELEGAAAAGLVRAQALLARALAPGDCDLEVTSADVRVDPERVRQLLIVALEARQR